MSRRTEIQVGATVLVALIVLLWGVTWLKEFSLQRKVRVWHVAFPQTGGLGASDEVQVNGIRKGAVTGIDLVGDHVIVNLGLSSDIRLTTDSQVAIRNVGLMGEKVIAVDLKTSGNPYTGRDTIPGVYEKGMPEVMAQMGNAVDAVSELAAELKNVAGVLQKSDDVKHTLSNFRETSEQLRLAVSENRKLLRSTLENFSDASKTAKELTSGREAELKRTLDSFERSATNLETLTARLDSLRAVMQEVAVKVDKGDGSLAKLVNDKRLYEEVTAGVKSLRELIEDLKKNPKKYINVRIL